jgi:hypothetical protein
LLKTKCTFIKPASKKILGEAENLEQSKQIHLTTTIMKTQDLNEQELIEINGGGLLSNLGLGNLGLGNLGSQLGLTGGLNIGNLLSLTSTTKSGTTTTLTLGNNIGLSLQQLASNILS